MRSLAGRLLALQLLIAAAAIIAVAVSTAWLTNHLLARQEEQELIQTAKSVAVEIGRDFEELGELRAAVRSTMEEGAPPRYRIEVLDSKRNLIFSSSPDSGLWARDAIRQHEVSLAGGGWVIATVSTAPRRQAMAALLSVLTLVSLLVLVLTLVAGRMLVRRELAPLARLAN